MRMTAHHIIITAGTNAVFGIKITHFGKQKHSSHHRRAYIKDSDGNVMDEEYSKRTQFMDKEALLKKQEEMRKSRVH
ncbi:MAG: hypothetical protein L6V93_20285 [Clostridiales bacterium]|nr:MAG: hypothetical protein L6V93_20285 [Clostridiales bacterium]